MPTTEQPQACPRCGGEVMVQKLGSRKWKVQCAKNAEARLVRCAEGHPMFTKGDAVREWNKLKA